VQVQVLSWAPDKSKPALLLLFLRSQKARMAELVDALVSGTSIRKDVQVRVLFRAQNSRLISAFFLGTGEKFIRQLAEVLFRAQNKRTLVCFFCAPQFTK
jgi:hypothetical protein